MGSEQSSQQARRAREERERARWNNYREATSSTSQAATARDVEVALEQQRKLYEKKVKDLLEEQQKKLQQQKAEILQASKRESIVTTTTTGPQFQPNFNSAERQRTPYNYNQNELKTALNSSPSILYPNLGASTSYHDHTSPRSCPSPSGYFTQTPKEFEKNQFKNNQQQTLALSAERQRTPYNYNQNELKTALNSSPSILYPNLGASTSYHDHTSPRSCPSPSGYFTQTPKEFEKNQFKNNQQQTLALSPDFKPSAPPSESSFNLSKFKGITVRSRSQSRQRSQNDEVKCPTCGQIFGEKIYQCNSGHSSCELCKTRQVACGQCRLQLTDRRNYDLEKYILETLQKKVKCPNSTEGCCLYVKLSELDNHAKECPFGVHNCPSLGFCNWNGKLSQLSSHFNDIHPMHLQGEVDKEMCIANIFETSHTMHYIRIGPFNFLFHVKINKAEKRVCMAAQLIGTKYSAAKWTYEIHIYKKSEPRRKFQYYDKCSSSKDPIEDIMKRAMCAVIPVEYAKTFICNEVLTYKFYIKKDEPTEDSVNDNSENKSKQNMKKYYRKKNKNSVC